MPDRPSLYIIDAYSLIFQVFHAIPAMAGPAGQPTNAVFGTFRDLLNLIRSRSPDYLLAAFDGAGPVFRNDLYDQYKANRQAMPEDLQVQIPVIQQVFEGFNVPVFQESGFEADDVIATLARQAANRGLDVFICTADKDARQLLDDRIRIFNIRKSEVFDTETLLRDWGIRPDQVVDLLSLTGDSVDNVPGVPGIGLKTGAELLQKFGDLDTLLSRIDEVSGTKRRENLHAHADTARRARSLVELRLDVPIQLDWDQARYQSYNHAALKQLCVACGFHRFLDEIEPADSSAGTAWSPVGYQTIQSADQLDHLLQTLHDRERFALHTVSRDSNPLRGELLGIAFCWDNAHAAYIPLGGPTDSTDLDPASVLAALKPVLENPATAKIGHNLKADLLALSRLGIELGGQLVDTMVLSYLLESGERNHNREELTRRLLDQTLTPLTELTGKGRAAIRLDQVPIEELALCASRAAEADFRLEAQLTQQVCTEGLWPLYDDLERPLIHVLARMEAAGIRVDGERLRQLSREFTARLDAIRDDIFELAGRLFQVSSAHQLREVLFQDLGLPVIKKTPKGEPSTDAEVLEALAPRHPLPRLIVQYRQLEKLKNTYLDTLPDLIQPDGRIHASFNQVVAATGRLSSSDPNLQNIPVRSEDGRQIRQAFVPGTPGWTLLAADYSQIELRVLAHFCQDPRLVQAFAEDRDIHTVVASEIFNVPLEQVSSEQRRMAKTVNFGVIYGLSGFGLASRLGIERADAELFINAYFQEYRGVADFITRTLTDARKLGRVQTILGRRRAVSGVKNTDRMRTQAERIAVNAVIQGSAADLIKQAMIDLDQALRETGLQARMLLQIHDELVFEAPQEELPDLARLVEARMTTALPLNVPIKVDLAAGPNWLDVAPIEVI